MDFIFSPIVESVAPAFNAGEQILGINYTIPDKVSINQIKHIGIRIVEQNSNNTVVNTSQFPDGIIYLDFDATAQLGSNRTVYINKSTLAEGHWKENTYYKIQLRFGTGDLTVTEFPKGDKVSAADFSKWKENYLKNYQFSEWSTVLLVKAILPPEIRLLNEAGKQQSALIINTAQGNEYSAAPLFEGVYKTDINEPITHYRFQLYNLTKQGELIEDSGWQLHNAANDLFYSQKYSHIDTNTNSQETTEAPTGGDQYRFKQTLIYDPNNPVEYGVVYSVRTLNLYETTTNRYDFVIVETAVESLPEWLNFKFVEDDEEGLIDLILSSNDDNAYFQLSGTYVISRTSEKSNFGLWEDVKFLNWTGESFLKAGKSIFKDYTVESGVQYKYAIASQNSYNIRTNKKIALNNLRETAEVNFQYAYLYDAGIQLKLKYDNKMSSFKRTTLTNKQDSLGSQYPILMRHGSANYSEFPIGGLLSLHSDEAQNFFELKEKNDEIGYYYKDELVIPARKLNDQTRRGNRAVIDYDYNTNLTDDNTYIERIFREKAEAFLNDGRYKLFKSPTEGNIIVGLINISMTPNEQLSRMIYSFTSTAYEVLENTYDNLVAYGIQERGESAAQKETSFYLCGQINDLMVGDAKNSWKDIELRQMVADQISSLVADSVESKIYRYQLKNIESISFEPFPDAEYDTEILYLEGQINEYHSQREEDRTEEETTRYESNKIELGRLKRIVANLRNKLNSYKIGINIKFGGVSTKIYLGFNQVYHLTDLANLFADGEGKQDGLTITIIPQHDNVYIPMLCNYVASAQLTEDIRYVVNKVESATAWGQVSGIFTNNKDLYNMHQSMDKQYIPMEIYNTLNITDITNEYVKKQVTQSKGIADENYFNTYDEEEKVYYNKNNPNLYLRILGYELIDIECDKYNQLIISGVKDTYKPVIGPTNRYVLKYTEVDNVQTIELTQPAHCIINFQALCSIESRGEVIS